MAETGMFCGRIRITMINKFLPSIIAPSVLNIILILPNVFDRMIHVWTILSGGFGFYSFFTFPLVNLVGWSTYWIIHKLKLLDNVFYSYIIVFLIAGISAILFVAALAGWGYSLSLYCYYFISCAPIGILFLYLTKR